MNLKVISQIKEVYTNEIKYLLVQSVNGEIGILPHHQDMITKLKLGNIVLINQSDEKKEIYISSGIMQIKSNNIIIIAELANLKEEVLKSEVEKAILLAEKKISETINPEELIQLEKIIRYNKFIKKEIDY